MRMIVGATLLALGMAAQPAFAWEGAAPPVTPAPLPTVTAPDAAPAPETIATVYRLPTVTLPATDLAATLDSETAALRHRFTGSMMEFYPSAGSGFHLSAGTRLYARRNFTYETENSARGALVGAHSTMAPIISKSGFRKFDPAVTAGYTVAVSTMARIGVEGGAMMSRLFAGAPGLPTHGFGNREAFAFRPNPVANLVFGLHF